MQGKVLQQLHSHLGLQDGARGHHARQMHSRSRHILTGWAPLWSSNTLCPASTCLPVHQTSVAIYMVASLLKHPAACRHCAMGAGNSGKPQPWPFCYCYRVMSASHDACPPALVSDAELRFEGYCCCRRCPLADTTEPCRYLGLHANQHSCCVRAEQVVCLPAAGFFV